MERPLSKSPTSGNLVQAHRGSTRQENNDASLNTDSAIETNQTAVPEADTQAAAQRQLASINFKQIKHLMNELRAGISVTAERETTIASKLGLEIQQVREWLQMYTEIKEMVALEASTSEDRLEKKSKNTSYFTEKYEAIFSQFTRNEMAQKLIPDNMQVLHTANATDSSSQPSVSHNGQLNHMNPRLLHESDRSSLNQFTSQNLSWTGSSSRTGESDGFFDDSINEEAIQGDQYRTIAEHTAMGQHSNPVQSEIPSGSRIRGPRSQNAIQQDETPSSTTE